MPTPIAHSAVWIIGRKWAPRWLSIPNDRDRLHGFAAASVGLLVWPDCDFLLSRLTNVPAFAHGGATHSLLAGALAAAAYAAFCRWALRIRAGALPLFIVGLALAWSHPLMDVVTYRGGVQLFWPFSETEIIGPPLFYGARHSQPEAWPLHLITLSTELAFAGLLAAMSRRST